MIKKKKILVFLGKEKILIFLHKNRKKVHNE